jgi:hypothetical protein
MVARIRRMLSVSLSLGVMSFAYAQPVTKAPPAAPAMDYVNMSFRGDYRAFPKTHYARYSDGKMVATEIFDDLHALKKTLPPDERMRQKYADQLGNNARFPEELRNVSVVAYLHAVRLKYGIDAHGNQADLNFQVLLGTSPRQGEGRFFSAEVSGLPHGGGDIASFSATRRQVVQLVTHVAKVPEKSFRAAFAQINPPIKVKVTGSLLFDAQVRAGSAGPDYAKADSGWQINPVISIDQQ